MESSCKEHCKHIFDLLLNSLLHYCSYYYCKVWMMSQTKAVSFSLYSIYCGLILLLHLFVCVVHVTPYNAVGGVGTFRSVSCYINSSCYYVIDMKIVGSQNWILDTPLLGLEWETIKKIDQNHSKGMPDMVSGLLCRMLQAL